MESAEWNLNLRLMGGKDVDAVVKIQAASAEIAQWTAGDYARLALTGTMAWVAELEGAVAGFLVARQIGNDIEILNLAVRPDARRRGIGHALIRFTFEWGKQFHAKSTFLEVRASNRDALQFYKQHGFEETGRRPLYYSNPVEDALVLKACIS
ncbi:MAG TPA: ribosomal protein S18-alanine N-acetyltransferase [Candidatus Acidoferrales bacterium]